MTYGSLPGSTGELVIAKLIVMISKFQILGNRVCLTGGVFGETEVILFIGVKNQPERDSCIRWRIKGCQRSLLRVYSLIKRNRLYHSILLLF